ncbi:hypothetical protein DMB95_08965 [Campylobacter sp. MIT 12-8780]|nr:hypothetical protein DMB95_08965 [Campylobacter sp. MIT 12-8780]
MSTIFSIIRISLSIVLTSLLVFSFIIGICIFCKMFNDAIKAIFEKIKARDYKSAFLYICGLIIIICVSICCVLLIVMYFSNVDLKC